MTEFNPEILNIRMDNLIFALYELKWDILPIYAIVLSDPKLEWTSREITNIYNEIEDLLYREKPMKSSECSF